MNKSKTKKLALLTTVVILVVCLIPAVQGVKTSNKNINIRDIDEWLAYNPFGSSRGFLDPDTWLIQRCPGDSVYDAESFTGYIVEKLMKDGSLHITIHLSVEGMPMHVIQTDEDFMTWDVIFEGLMDYTYTAEIILEKEIPGGHLYDWDFGPLVLDEDGFSAPLIVSGGYIPEDDREPGADLAPWWVILYYLHEFGGHFEKMEFKSKGSGNFIESGEEGNVKCHQVAIYGYNLPLNNPSVYQYTSWSVPEGVFFDGGSLVQSPLCIPEMWPVEYVKFY